MEYTSGYFPGAKKQQLYYQAWYEGHLPKAVVAIAHGLGCHSGTFTHAVNYFIHQGYAVYALDHRGHGRSDGQRGYINTWLEYREDFQAFLKLVEQQQPDRPLFAWGHSLGSMIVLDYVLCCTHHLQGIIVSGLPMGEVGVSKEKLAIARLLSQYWPRFSLNTGIDPASNSRDPATLLEHAQDTLRHTKGTARLATEVFRIQAELEDHAADLDLPVLMLHGGSDQTAPPAGSRAFFQDLGGANKQRREYEGMYHDLHTDLDSEVVLMDIHQWLKQRIRDYRPAQDVTPLRCKPFFA